jgi:hypothetical protein
MRFERLESELKQRFYEQNRLSGIDVNNRRCILDLTDVKYAFK